MFLLSSRDVPTLTTGDNSHHVAFCGRKKRQLEGIRRESTWFPPASPHVESERVSETLRDKRASSLFLPFASRVAWNSRYPSRPVADYALAVPLELFALKMYQSRPAAMFCRGCSAWNLKGVIKNNARRDFSDDEREVKRVIRDPCVFSTPEEPVGC